MRSDVVVEALVFGQRGGDVPDGHFSLAEAPELGSGAVVGALDDAVELGALGRQDGQREVQRLAGVLEPGAELAASWARVQREGLVRRGRRLLAARPFTPRARWRARQR